MLAGHVTGLTGTGFSGSASAGLAAGTAGNAARYGAGALVGGSMAGLSGGDLWRQAGQSALLGGAIGFG